MKSKNLLSTLVCVAIFAFCSGCSGNGNTESVQDKQLRLLVKTWKVESVYYGQGKSVDSTAHWENFKLDIYGTKGYNVVQYTCLGRPRLSPWPIAGTLTFSSSTPATNLLRNDDATISYSVNSSSTHLQLSFNFAGTGYTRVGSVGGYWTFNFIPN